VELLATVFSPSWIGVFIGGIGVVAGYIFYRASRIGPRPLYQFRALRLIGKQEQALPEEVEILFRGRSVPRLTKTQVILWNSGNVMLDGKNIVVDDPLRLELNKGAQVLKLHVLKVTRTSNKFKARINPNSPNELICSFDYLDPGDEAAIELLHTDQKRYPKVQGTIRGVPKGVLNRGRIRPSTSPIFGFINIFIGVVIVAYAFSISRTSKSLTPEMLSILTILTRTMLLFGLTYISGGLFRFWRTRSRFPKSLLFVDF